MPADKAISVITISTVMRGSYGPHVEHSIGSEVPSCVTFSCVDAQSPKERPRRWGVNQQGQVGNVLASPCASALIRHPRVSIRATYLGLVLAFVALRSPSTLDDCQEQEDERRNNDKTDDEGERFAASELYLRHGRSRCRVV